MVLSFKLKIHEPFYTPIVTLFNMGRKCGRYVNGQKINESGCVTAR